jgi:hypothetical protein
MVREGQHSGIDDDTRRRAMAFAKDADNPMPAVTAKPKLPKQRMVTKKELDASGLSLRDFLNRERGLTRREDKPMSKADAAKQLKLGEKPSKEAVDSAKARLGVENPTEASYKPVLKPGTYVNEENKDATNETFKKGGSVSASRRADGIAQRGKTRGRVC